MQFRNSLTYGYCGRYNLVTVGQGRSPDIDRKFFYFFFLASTLRRASFSFCLFIPILFCNPLWLLFSEESIKTINLYGHNIYIFFLYNKKLIKISKLIIFLMFFLKTLWKSTFNLSNGWKNFKSNNLAVLEETTMSLQRLNKQKQ